MYGRSPNPLARRWSVGGTNCPSKWDKHSQFGTQNTCNTSSPRCTACTHARYMGETRGAHNTHTRTYSSQQSTSALLPPLTRDCSLPFKRILSIIMCDSRRTKAFTCSLGHECACTCVSVCNGDRHTKHHCHPTTVDPMTRCRWSGSIVGVRQ